MKIELISLARLARAIGRKHRVNRRLNRGALTTQPSSFIPLTRD